MNGRRCDVESNAGGFHTLDVHEELAFDLSRIYAVCDSGVENDGRYRQVVQLREGVELHRNRLGDLVGVGTVADDGVDAGAVLLLAFCGRGGGHGGEQSGHDGGGEHICDWTGDGGDCDSAHRVGSVVSI